MWSRSAVAGADRAGPDATDIPLYGHQPERFFHGYYGSYCYLPLYIFAGDQLLCARLRAANQDAAAGAVQEVSRIVAQLRQRWPQTRMVLRADSGFCREELMGWCEANQVDYLFGLARNKRLQKIIGAQMQQARVLHQSTGKATRVFTGFAYATRKSWSCARRVVAKAEYLDKGENPRFVVTSLTPDQWPDQALYRSSTTPAAKWKTASRTDVPVRRSALTDEIGNELRLYFSALAYTLMEALRGWACMAQRGPRLRSIPSASSCSRSVPSCASACAALCCSSTPPIPGKTSSLKPSTPCAVETRCRRSTTLPPWPRAPALAEPCKKPPC